MEYCSAQLSQVSMICSLYLNSWSTTRKYYLSLAKRTTQLRWDVDGASCLSQSSTPIWNIDSISKEVLPLVQLRLKRATLVRSDGGIADLSPDFMCMGKHFEIYQVMWKCIWTTSLRLVCWTRNCLFLAQDSDTIWLRTCSTKTLFITYVMGILLYKCSWRSSITLILWNSSLSSGRLWWLEN